MLDNENPEKPLLIKKNKKNNWFEAGGIRTRVSKHNQVCPQGHIQFNSVLLAERLLQ